MVPAQQSQARHVGGDQNLVLGRDLPVLDQVRNQDRWRWNCRSQAMMSSFNVNTAVYTHDDSEIERSTVTHFAQQRTSRSSSIGDALADQGCARMLQEVQPTHSDLRDDPR